MGYSLLASDRILIGAFASGNRSGSSSIAKHYNYGSEECQKPNCGLCHFVDRVKEKTEGGVEYLR